MRRGVPNAENKIERIFHSMNSEQGSKKKESEREKKSAILSLLTHIRLLTVTENGPKKKQ